MRELDSTARRVPETRPGDAGVSAVLIVTMVVVWLALDRVELPGLGVDVRGGIHIREPGHALLVDPTTALVQLSTPGGQTYTTFPLAALAGRTALPAASRVHVSRNGSTLLSEVAAKDGTPLRRTLLSAGPTSFTIRFDCRPGPELHLEP